ncbi:uncharacterized protein LOC128712421 [Anopheles marshallii]|uniref:uncharacterized protein LOC128712421 n=1 Tax=Anopheles marshallii TaxID=1521116 RepID=UPI00237BD83C|nr:uncharacterized protein LOC128712421 [Anopheles marshallii]
MERLNKIIVKKYFTSNEHIKPSDLLTDEEYQIVKNCQLNDLLKTETHPAALDRICEGEKLQTAEFYEQKEKRYKRDVVKLSRKPGKGAGQPRTVRQVVPSHDTQTVTVDDLPSTRNNQPSAQLIATEGVMEPTRSNESHGPPNDPYQLREEIAPIPIVMPLAVLPDDENFGSNDVDGARDFLQLCTGEKLPPMSMRQTMTRDMLLSQLPSIPIVPPLADNFQELDLKSINTPMFKRPLGTSTPLVTGQVAQMGLDGSNLDAQIPLPALPQYLAEEIVGGPTESPTDAVPLDTAVASIPATVAAVPATVAAVPATVAAVSTEVQPGPSRENSGPSCSRVSARPAIVESNSSSELLAAPAPRRRRIQQESSFTERLEPFEMTVSFPKPRRNFDIFSFPYHAIWNKAIQDVQNQLSESYKQHQLRELLVMREVAPEAQRIDSGFQQTPYELTSRPPTMSVTETSNLVAINQIGGKQSNVQSIQQDTLMTPDMVASIHPNELEALGSIDGKLTEVSERFHLKPITDGTSTGQEKTATEQLQPVENVPTVLKESLKDNVVQPVVETDSRPEKKPKRGNRNMKTPVHNENDPMPDVSSVLFNQAQELETIATNEEAVEEMLPIDTMVVDILLTVQGAMNNEEQLGHPLSLQRLRQLLQANSCLSAAKLFKNIILLKQANLLTVESNVDHYICNVSLKLPQVDVSDATLITPV